MTAEQEVWLPIAEFPMYSVSNLSRVRRDKAGLILRGQLQQWGYYAVSLYKDTWRRGYIRKIHLLVLTTFVGERPNGLQCRHLDVDSTNNHLDNLKWGTPKENMQDQKRHGTLVDSSGEKNGMAKLGVVDVLDIRRLATTFSQRQLARMFDVTQTSIRYIIHRKTRRFV